MNHQWQALLELLWPSRYDPVASRRRRIALLQAGIAVAIALAAGPEIYAAMEMTALLEVLGAILFLTAFAAGARLLAMRIRGALCRVLLPAPQVFFLRSNASTPAKALALIYVTTHAAWYLALFLSGRVMVSTWPEDWAAA